MIGNLGATHFKGYDSDGNSKWFPGGLPQGYTPRPIEIKQPEIPPVVSKEDPPKKGPGRPPSQK